MKKLVCSVQSSGKNLVKKVCIYKSGNVHLEIYFLNYIIYKWGEVGSVMTGGRTGGEWSEMVPAQVHSHAPSPIPHDLVHVHVGSNP